MNVDFYFDPTCPFCWITSRWLINVSKKRDVEITWKPFSLALKNNVLEKSSPSEHDVFAANSLRFLRVALAVNKKYDIRLLDLYTAAGTAFHLNSTPLIDSTIVQILTEFNVPKELIDEADNSQYDKLIQESMNEAMQYVGKDVGVPIIIIENESLKQGFFGPVLNELPGPEESLQIWDGLRALSGSRSFYELKRTRPDGMPNTASTLEANQTK